MIALVLAAALAGGISQQSTSYCLDGRTADGTYLSKSRPSRRALRTLAHNGFPLGTRVWVEPAVRYRHRWVVRDRIGWGSQADFWAPSCGEAISYGRRTVHIRRGWRRPRR